MKKVQNGMKHLRLSICYVGALSYSLSLVSISVLVCWDNCIERVHMCTWLSTSATKHISAHQVSVIVPHIQSRGHILPCSMLQSLHDSKRAAQTVCSNVYKLPVYFACTSDNPQTFSTITKPAVSASSWATHGPPFLCTRFFFFNAASCCALLM